MNTVLAPRVLGKVNTKEQLIEWLTENVGKYQGFLDDAEFGEGWTMHPKILRDKIENNTGWTYANPKFYWSVTFEKEEDAVLFNLRFNES